MSNPVLVIELTGVQNNFNGFGGMAFGLGAPTFGLAGVDFATAPAVGDDLFLLTQAVSLGDPASLGNAFVSPLANPVTFSINDSGGHLWDVFVLTDDLVLYHTKIVTTPLVVDLFTVTVPPQEFVIGGAFNPLLLSWAIACVRGANSLDLVLGGGNGSSTAGAITIPGWQGSPLAVDVNFSSFAIDWVGMFLVFRGDTQDFIFGFLASDTFSPDSPPDLSSIPSFSISGTQTDSFGGSWFISSAAHAAILSYTPGSGLAGDIVSDICKRAGLDASQIDVSLLTDANIFGGTTAVTGYVIEQQASAAEILKPLLLAYFFDGCESDGKVKFVPRGAAPVLTIPEADLGLMEDGAKIKPEQITPEQDLPLTVTVIYKDIALDYQQGSKARTRSSRIKNTRQRENYSIPLVLSGSQALQTAEALLYLAWLERHSFTFNLASPQYMTLDPTDVIKFVYEGLTFEIRVTNNLLGQGFAVQITGLDHDVQNFLSDLEAPLPIAILNGLRLVGPSVFFLFDLPLLVDSDANAGGTGFYFAAASAVVGWTGMVLYSASDDSNFAPGTTDSDSVTYGVATTTLGAPRSPWELDAVNTLTIQLVTGSLAGETLLNVLNGSNALIVGGEIIQFVDAIQNMDGTYTISNLLRGRRGTESACGSHGSGESVIAPATGIKRVAKTLSALGQTLFYRGVTVGQDPSAVASRQFAISGADLRPYAPAGVGGTIDGSGNITITWARRTRIGGEADWADGVGTVPLGEDFESYDVEILNGSTVVRTISGLTTPTAVYSAAMQTADFGSPQTSVNVNVYQRSAQVGRGSKATGTAPTPGGWPPPWPAVASTAPPQVFINGS